MLGKDVTKHAQKLREVCSDPSLMRWVSCLVAHIPPSQYCVSTAVCRKITRQKSKQEVTHTTQPRELRYSVLGQAACGFSLEGFLI